MQGEDGYGRICSVRCCLGGWWVAVSFTAPVSSVQIFCLSLYQSRSRHGCCCCCRWIRNHSGYIAPLFFFLLGSLERAAGQGPDWVQTGSGGSLHGRHCRQHLRIRWGATAMILKLYTIYASIYIKGIHLMFPCVLTIHWTKSMLPWTSLPAQLGRKWQAV